METAGCLILYGPWSKLTSQDHLTVLDLRNLLQQNLSKIKETSAPIRSAGQLFEETRCVRPIECDLAISSIQTLRCAMQELHEVLGNIRQLPKPVIPERHHLLIPLGIIDEQAQSVKSLITTFRSICFESSLHTIRQQQTIEDQLYRLAQRSEGISFQGQLFLDQLTG